MYYKYETHMHTSEVSRCSSSSAAEMARKYKDEGYTGIIVTDHFLNGNTVIDLSLPWKEKIALYTLGYEHAREEGAKIGLDVFFGVEYGNGQADFLTYGPDGEWLAEHPEIMNFSVPDYIAYMQVHGFMVVHAHPFREAGYIHSFTLVPTVDAVEIVNASHRDPAYNERAKWYAEQYDLPVTAGSDSHNTTDRFFKGGVVTDHRLTCVGDYISAVRERRLAGLLPDEKY